MAGQNVEYTWWETGIDTQLTKQSGLDQTLAHISHQNVGRTYCQRSLL